MITFDQILQTECINTTTTAEAEAEPTGGIYGGTTEPNGSFTATGPAIYVQDDGAGATLYIWSKPDGVTGDTGWV